jgi:hypothetical protein
MDNRWRANFRGDVAHGRTLEKGSKWRAIVALLAVIRIRIREEPQSAITWPTGGLPARQFERKSVGVYVCPACAAVLPLTAGSIVPRPCPECLESTGRVVEMVLQQPQPPDPQALEQQ